MTNDEGGGRIVGERAISQICHPERSATTSKDLAKGARVRLVFVLGKTSMAGHRSVPHTIRACWPQANRVDRTAVSQGGVLRRRCTPLRMTEVLKGALTHYPPSAFVIRHSSFVIRHSSLSEQHPSITSACRDPSAAVSSSLASSAAVPPAPIHQRFLCLCAESSFRPPRCLR